MSDLKPNNLVFEIPLSKAKFKYTEAVRGILKGMAEYKDISFGDNCVVVFGERGLNISVRAVFLEGANNDEILEVIGDLDGYKAHSLGYVISASEVETDRVLRSM